MHCIHVLSFIALSGVVLRRVASCYHFFIILKQIYNYYFHAQILLFITIVIHPIPMHAYHRYTQVVRQSLRIFEQKFAHFRQHIGAMDSLFEASFSPLAATGKNMGKCGRCSRYMRYIHLRPQVKFLSSYRYIKFYLFCCWSKQHLSFLTTWLQNTATLHCL